MAKKTTQEILTAFIENADHYKAGLGAERYAQMVEELKKKVEAETPSEPKKD